MTRTFPWELLKRCLPSCLPIGSFFEIPAVGVVLGAVPAAAAAPPTAPGRGGSTLVVISQRSQSVSQGSLPSFLRSVSQSVCQAAVMKAAFMTRAEKERAIVRQSGDTALEKRCDVLSARPSAAE